MSFIKNHSTFAAFFVFTALTIILFWPSIARQQVPLPTDVVTAYMLDTPRQGENPWIRDAVVQLYPYTDFIFDSWKRGQVPGVNEMIFAGVTGLGPTGLDMAATGQADIWAPVNIFIPFFRDSLSFFTFKVIAYFWLSGVAMFLYFRYSRTVSAPLATLAGVMFMFAGPLMVWQAWGTIVGVIACMPLMLLGLEQFFATRRPVWLALFTFANFASAANGHFQFYAYSALFTIAYSVWLLWSHRRTFDGKSLYWLSGTVLLNGVLIALLAAPFLIAAPESHRATIGGTVRLYVEHLGQLFIPDLYGSVNAYRAKLNYIETSMYVGVLPLLTIAIAKAHYFRRNWFAGRGFWIGAFAFLMLLNLAPIVLTPVFTVLPFLESFPPFRSLFLIDFILIFFTIDILRQWETDSAHLTVRSRTGAMIALVMALPAAAIIALGLLGKIGRITAVELYAPFAVVGVAIVVLFLLYQRKKLSFTAMTSVLVLVAIADGLLAFNGFTPQQPRTPLEEPPAYVQFLQEQHSPLIYSELSPLNLYMLYDIRSIFGYDSNYSEEYYHLIAENAKEVKSHRNILNATITDREFLRSIGVDYIVTRRTLNNIEPAYSASGVNVYSLTE